MPIKGGRYRVVQSSKGPVRIHIAKGGRVDEAKNLKTGATHTQGEFKKDRKQGK